MANSSLETLAATVATDRGCSLEAARVAIRIEMVRTATALGSISLAEGLCPETPGCPESPQAASEGPSPGPAPSNDVWLRRLAAFFEIVLGSAWDESRSPWDALCLDTHAAELDEPGTPTAGGVWPHAHQARVARLLAALGAPPSTPEEIQAERREIGAE